MGPDKPSNLVTTLSNYLSLLRGGLVEGEWGSLGWWPGRTIAGSQDFIPGAEPRFQLSRDFTDGCHTWDPRGYTYNVLVRFFPLQCVYRFESRLWVATCHCSHLVVCLVYCWWDRGVGYGYGYNYIIITIIVSTYLWHWHGSTFCLFMLVLVCRCKHSTWLKLKLLK